MKKGGREWMAERHYRTFGPDKVPLTAFNYWECINDLTAVHRHDDDVNKVIQDSASFLEGALRRTYSSLELGPANNEKEQKEEDSVSITAPLDKTSNNSPLRLRTKKIYPSLGENPLVALRDEPLDPASSAELGGEAARYKDPDCAFPVLSKANITAPLRPPPYCIMPAFPSSSNTAPAPSAAPAPSPRDLKTQVRSLRETLQLTKERNDLLKELRLLDLELSQQPAPAAPAPPAPPPPRPAPKSSHSRGSRSESSSSLQPFPVIEAHPVKSDEEEDPEPRRECRRFGYKTLRELKSAVSQYGPVAPFTLSILEALDHLWLTSIDWHHLARATLSGGDFVLWKSEFKEICKDTARRNAEAGGDSAGWSFEMLVGARPYDTNEAQTRSWKQPAA
ncbi:uncharacterized protein LOC141539927 [Sminthopsis crassicaudata]|uniref:uncharacterized protein LOC141539927 n=1 Tax=Sminthopsis crassicaudata TaxID=9301 RepID=UPI003D69A8AA